MTWVYQMRGGGHLESTPIVVDGIMYVTEPPSNVTALDARTGKPLWRYDPPIPTDLVRDRALPHESRRGRARRQSLRRHDRRAPDRARREKRRGALEHANRATTRPATPSRRRRSRSMARSSSASAEARRAAQDSRALRRERRKAVVAAFTRSAQPQRSRRGYLGRRKLVESAAEPRGTQARTIRN